MKHLNLLFGTGVSATKDSGELYELVKLCIKNGITGFDTAPSYRTESMLGDAVNRCIDEKLIDRKDLFVQSKIDGWQMQDGNIEKYVKNALKKMNLEYFDALLIHWPFPEYFEDTWNKLTYLKETQLVNKIGICNLRIRHLKDLESRGIIPEIVQIERNPLNVMEKEVFFADEKDIWFQAYSPLCKMDERIKESADLNNIAEKYNKNIGQVVLRWHIDTGVSPIFTSKKSSRIEEYADLFDFRLNNEEIECISALNVNYKMYLESFQCPGI